MSIADARCNQVRFPDVFHFLGLLLSVEMKLNTKKFRTFHIASANRVFLGRKPPFLSPKRIDCLKRIRENCRDWFPAPMSTPHAGSRFAKHRNNSTTVLTGRVLKWG